MLDFKGIINATGKVTSWKQVVIVLAIIGAMLMYVLNNNPTEVQEYYQNGKIQKISKFK